MNAAIIALFGIVWFIFAYNWYGKIIQKRVIHSNDDNITPSNEINDNMDFVPTKPAILFGHHFSSIAGAGPIIGPILAFAWFGWLPAVLWILVGSVFVGAVHDYTSLMISIRHKGNSIVEITDKIISGKAKVIFASFVWLTLMLIQAVFADLTAKTLAEKPDIVIPTIGIIIIALFFGFFVIRGKLNLIVSTIIALAMLVGLVILGDIYPVTMSYQFWLLFCFVYSLIAATLPVWLLLQPRDYLSVYILIAGLLGAFIGLMILQPEINAPAFTGFESDHGPLFPMLFITVACGAVSGFHSLVSSGTSSKQLNKEHDGKIIAYGGMLTEGFLALLVVLMVGSMLVWAYPGMAAGGEYVFQTLHAKSVNIVFGTALGRTVESMGIPIGIGISLGVLMLNAFILTTLDTSARLNRYVIQETLGAKYGGIFKNRYAATSLSLIVAYILCQTDGYKAIWTLFGASNQLIATLALFIVTVYFIGFKANKWYTLFPAFIMLLVTEAALAYKTFWQYLPESNYPLLAITLFLLVLGVVVAWEVVQKIRNLEKKKS